eukprot:scaffold13786_cov31-Tisochrysis_lutea.AAC.4
MWVPHLVHSAVSVSQPGVRWGREHDGRRPSPIFQYEEEAFEQHGGGRLRVQLADEGAEQVAIDPTEVAHLVRVDPAALRPEADAAKELAERREVRNQVLDEIGDARAVERALRAGVESLKDGVVVEVNCVRHRFQR